MTTYFDAFDNKLHDTGVDAETSKRCRYCECADALAGTPPAAECTGLSAQWCPACGDCACGPRYEGGRDGGERTLSDDGCPLHSAASRHALADAIAATGGR